MLDNIMLIAGVPGALLLIIAIIATAIIYKYLGSKKEVALETITNEKLRTYVDLLWSTVMVTVEATNQTMVDGLKAAHEDGKLTEEEAKLVKDTTVEMVLETLSADAKAVLDLAFDDLSKQVGIMIESAVRSAKNELPLG